MCRTMVTIIEITPTAVTIGHIDIITMMATGMIAIGMITGAVEPHRRWYDY